MALQRAGRASALAARRSGQPPAGQKDVGAGVALRTGRQRAGGVRAGAAPPAELTVGADTGVATSTAVGAGGPELRVGVAGTGVAWAAGVELGAAAPGVRGTAVV
jgi:hypothetical protein